MVSSRAWSKDTGQMISPSHSMKFTELSSSGTTSRRAVSDFRAMAIRSFAVLFAGGSVHAAPRLLLFGPPPAVVVGVGEIGEHDLGRRRDPAFELDRCHGFPGAQTIQVELN